MKVLIVGKTHLGPGQACVGGLCLQTGRSVRLFPPRCQYYSSEVIIDVGQVWEIEFEKVRCLKAPHVEDVEVSKATFIENMEHVAAYLRLNVNCWQRSPQEIFEEKLRFSPQGRGYISRDAIPAGSTGFWIPDEPLTLNDGYYEYDAPSFNFTVKHVGFEEPVRVIPPNSVVRISLARWWRPREAPDMEERCYLQLSGWFLE